MCVYRFLSTFTVHITLRYQHNELRRVVAGDRVVLWTFLRANVNLMVFY